MKALVLRGKNTIKLEDKPKPTIQEPTDAIIKIVYTTICGSDLHILQGHVPTCKEGTTIGHEGMGVIEECGSAVRAYQAGDRVLISCISSCASCQMCKNGMYSHCEKGGGWILGHTVDGTQAEYVRIPLADASLHKVPEGVDEKALVMLSDIGPTGYEVGVLAGQVKPGSSVVIVGTGPVGLSALMTAKLLSPSILIAVDKDAGRLEAAKKMGASHTLDAGSNVKDKVMELTNGRGCDVVIEAVGVPASFELCQDLVAFGGNIANIGVHGAPATLHLEKLWGYNITMTMGFVNTTSTATLLKMFQAGTLKLEQLITHEFSLQKDGEQAYATFGAAAQHKALKMIMTTS